MAYFYGFLFYHYIYFIRLKMTDEFYEEALKELEEIFGIEFPYEMIMLYLSLKYGDIDEEQL